MIIREIKPLDTLEVRQKILRPNNCIKDCIFPGDDDSSTKHFGAFNGNLLIGIVSIYKRENSGFHGNGYQVRAMATLSQDRGKGVGAKLLKRAEEYAFENGANYIWANARVSAKEFYQKSNYNIDAEQFNIEGVGLHVIVSKTHA